MLIGVPLETVGRRDAAWPSRPRRPRADGARSHVRVQSGAGVAASVGRTPPSRRWRRDHGRHRRLRCDLVLKVRTPQHSELTQMKAGANLVGMPQPVRQRRAGAARRGRLTSFALEAAPRTTRAQSMDVLSSQANIAGYKAVMIAADKYQRFFPMLDDRGRHRQGRARRDPRRRVAGLQAIATAKRLGAVIEASDVRPSVKEQIESLGGKFIEVSLRHPEEKEAAEGVGGYAKPMPPSWLARQQVEVAKRVALADIVISTALIPGRAAPTLITEEMVKAMKPGSVIVDIAAGKGPDLAGGLTGGNCPLSEADKDGAQARRHDRRRDQPAGPRRGGCERALCAQHPRLPQARSCRRTARSACRWTTTSWWPA